jgi:ABC-type transport system involved in cytochrome c biogenesis permease subunit
MGVANSSPFDFDKPWVLQGTVSPVIFSSSKMSSVASRANIMNSNRTPLRNAVGVLVALFSYASLYQPCTFLTYRKAVYPSITLAGAVVYGCCLHLGGGGTPAERRMGDTVKIHFVHVSAASLGMGGDGMSITFTVQDEGRSQKADLDQAACSWPIACSPSMAKTTYPKNWLTSI